VPNLTQLSPRLLTGLLGLSSRAARGEVAAFPAIAAGGPPGRRALVEAAGPAAALRLPAAALRLSRVPRGDGHLVVDIPGWKAPEATGAPLRGYLRHLGYDARPWGLGTNDGDPERDAALLADTVQRLAQDSGPVSLVGWSLGGTIAREVARTHPHAVRRVVTYGTPVIGGPTYTAGARSYGAAECGRITALIEELDRTQPIAVPVTAIYTRRDGVVAWQACIDRHSARVEHVEVFSTHLGLGLDPDVWELVAGTLSQPVATSSGKG
jgi:pimeloyl-ACP methyl ester carboxylesterase